MGGIRRVTEAVREAAVLALVVVRRALSMHREGTEDGKPERGVNSALENEARRSRGEGVADERGER